MDSAAKSNLWNYNHHLQPFANANRKTMTKAEACLWKFVIGKRQMGGYQFRRQRPVLNYIADFMCMELMLIIEVDGLTHQWAEVAENDIKRQKDLERIGFTVMRFDDEEVLEHINQVVFEIGEYIDIFEKVRKNHPLPPRRGTSTMHKI